MIFLKLIYFMYGRIPKYVILIIYPCVDAAALLLDCPTAGYIIFIVLF